MAKVNFDNKTYTFDELEKKYRQFYAPAFEVIIDGTSMIRESVAISSIKVDTTAASKADAFSFTVENGFDPVKREFKWINSFLAVGKYAEIKMGYTDRLETVFYGIVTNISLDYPSDGNPTIRVAGMDISFLMMKGKHSNSWKEKLDSDVVKSIGSKYGAKLHVDNTAVKKKIIEQNGLSDFQFIHSLAKQNHFEFMVVGKDLYFRKPKQNKSTVLSLMYGKNLMGFSTSVDISKQVSQIVVRGVNTETMKPVEAKSRNVDIIGTNSKTGNDIMNSLASYMVEYVYANVETQQEAQEMADAMMNEMAMDLVSGSGESIGIPELRAGRYIKLEGLGQKFNQPMYLSQVTHRIDKSGYITSFEARGNAI